MKLSGRLKLMLLAGAVALFLLAVIVGVLPSVLVNRPETRDLIRRHAAAAVGGEVDFGPIRLSLFPRVCATIDSPRASPANGIRVHADETAVCFQVWPLLRGRVEIDSVRIHAPVVRLPIAPVTPGGTPAGPPDPRPALVAAAKALEHVPEGRFEITRGRVELAAPEGPGFQVQDVELTLVRRGGEIELAAEGRSEMARRVSANARLQAERFTGTCRLRLEGIQPERPYAFFFPDRPFRILDTEGDLELDIAVDGPQRLTARATGRFPRLSASWKGGAAAVAIERWVGEAELTETRLALRIPELTAATPRVALALGWVIDADRHPRIELFLEGRGDAAGARAAALPFLADLEEGLLVCAIVRGGEVPHIRVELSGDTADDLTRLRNLRIDGRLEHGRIDLPFIAFDAEEVSGGFRIVDEFLEARDIQGRRNGLSGSDGFLRLGLRHERQELGLDLAVRADLGVLPDLLGRMIDDADFRRELKRVQAVAGRAAGRLRLSGKIPDVAIEVDATEIDAHGRHDAVPFPVGLQGGRLTYTRKELTLQGVDVTVGRSTLSRQDAVLELSGTRMLRASSPEAVIDLGEAYAWMEKVRPLAGLRGLEGSWRLAGWRAEGPVDNPGAWNVTASGALSSVAVTAEPLTSTVRIPSAAFTWQGRHLRLSDLAPTWGRSAVSGLNMDLDWSGTPRVSAQAARAALAVEDVLPLALNASPRLQAQLGPLLPLAGKLGLQAIHSDLRFPDNGVQVASAGAAVADASFSSPHLAHPLVLRSGTVALDGPRVRVSGLDAAFGRSEVRGFALTGGDGESLGVQAGSADIDCGDVFAAVSGLPAAAGLRQDVAAVSGALHLSEFRLNLPTSGRERWTAAADADIRGLVVTTPLLEDPVRIDAARVRAYDTGPGAPAPGVMVRLEATQVRSGRNSAEVAGGFTLTEAGTELDLTVAAESLDWGDITRTAERISRRPSSQEPSTLRGRVRLRAAQFVYARYRIEPLQLTAELGGPATTVLIDLARYCGMDFIGRVGVQGSQVSLYLVPVVAAADLDRTLRCATQESSIISGTFNLNGEFFGTGTTDAVLKALNGGLVATAERGTIRRSLFFARLLSLLNLTEIYRGRLPDLTTEGIDFQRSAARAEVKDGKIIVQEWSLQGPTFWMGGRGEIDLDTQEIDFTVMVSPFRTIDRIVNAIPGVRWILGGRLIAIPMRATGPLNDPQLSPLSPSAVGTSLLEMMKRTLMLPIQVIQPLVPGWEEDQGKATISR